MTIITVSKILSKQLYLKAEVTKTLFKENLHADMPLPLTSCHSPWLLPLLLDFLPLTLTSQFSPLPRNLKSTRSCPTVQASNPTQIPYRPGFLKNVHSYLFPQSRILSTSPSLPARFIPLSRNPLSHHCLRNQLWIKKNSPAIDQSRIYISFPK